MKKISLIFSFFNEETTIKYSIDKLTKILNELSNFNYELIFVNDCSTDNSLKILESERKLNKKIKIINLSRRFGHMPGIMAGIRSCSGDAAIYMDIDLQDPPEIIKDMLHAWDKENYDVVFTTRKKRLGETIFKKIISSIGYRILKLFTYIPIENDSGDFRLISRKVIEHVKDFSEINPFYRFIVDYVGFKRKQIFYTRDPRKVGKSKFPLGLRVINQFFEISLVPFSDAPLRFLFLVGILSFVITLILIIHTLFMKISGQVLPGWTAIMISVLCLASIQSLGLGIVSIYIGSIFKETKKRPLYIIENKIGFEE